MTEPLPSVEALLPAVRRAGIALPPGEIRVGAFGDSAALSEELLDLIRHGNKRGGASLVWAHEFDGESLPRAGEIEIVVDHLHRPALVTLTTQVEVVPFNEVGAAFAAREAEGDGSLAYWREAHWAFFSRECRRIGREPDETMPVACASFELLGVLPVEGPLADEPADPPRTALAFLVSTAPSFEAVWKEAGYAPEEVTLHRVIAEFAVHFSREHRTWSPRQLAVLGRWLSQAVSAPGPLENAVSTAFLEHARQLKVNRVLAPHLSGIAKERLRA